MIIILSNMNLILARISLWQMVCLGGGKNKLFSTILALVFMIKIGLCISYSQHHHYY